MPVRKMEGRFLGGETRLYMVSSEGDRPSAGRLFRIGESGKTAGLLFSGGRLERPLVSILT